MKVTDVNQAAPLDRVKAPEAAKPSPSDDSSSAVGERVTVDGARQIEPAVLAAKSAVGGGRAAQLERLEAQVRSGGYRPDPSRLAEQILSDAEVDARLQAMLQR